MRRTGADRLVIGIDARAATEVAAGRGRVVRELLRALARREDPHRYRLFVREPWDEPLDERFEQVSIPAPDGLWHARVGASATRTTDVFLSTNSYLTAWFTRVPVAVMVYDLIAFRPGAAPHRLSAVIEAATIRPALRRAGALACISAATRADLTARFPFAAAKARVIPLAADLRFGRALRTDQLAAVRERYGLEQPFVLFTGTLEPRKNLPRLIEAWAGLAPPARRDHRLLLVGPKGWEADELLATAAGEPGVALLGFVPDDDLAALYQLCSVFCYPSLYEGFGLPLLEAMQSGAACITTRISSLTEVGGDAVRYLDDPHDVEGLRRVLEELLERPDERARLGANAREAAATFSWERTADDTLRLLVSLARSGSGRAP